MEEFLALPVAPNALVGLIVPGVPVQLPYPFPAVGTCYVGALAVVFTVEGMRSLGRRELFFAGVLVVGGLLALGPFSPVGAMAYRIMGLNAFRYGFKHVFEVMFALSTLAARGAQSLLNQKKGATGTIIIAAIATLVLVPVYASPAMVREGFRGK